MLGLVSAALLGVAAVACATDLKPVEDRVAKLEGDLAGVKTQVSAAQGQAGKIADPAKTRHYYVTGVEWKGTTTAKNLQPPDKNPTTLSAGYGFKGPGYDATAPDKWEVGTYTWTPGSMMAYQGDKVAMTVFIVNGDTHSTWIEAPDGTRVVQPVDMQRGREYKVAFDATQAGVYKMVCSSHAPSMTGYVQVVPRG
jgi:plastocyanin